MQNFIAQELLFRFVVILMSINERIIELDKSIVNKALYDIDLESYYIDAITKVLLQKARVLLPPHREVYTPKEITYTISELQKFIQSVIRTLSYHGTWDILDSVQWHKIVHWLINRWFYDIDDTILADQKISDNAIKNVKIVLENLVL